MDAWEILTSNSSLTPASTYNAWEHLNAQIGGGTGYPTYVYMPNPNVIISSFGDIHMSSDNSLPYLEVDNTLEFKPVISSNNEEIALKINLLKPSLSIH